MEDNDQKRIRDFSRPTYIKVNHEQLSPETLNAYELPWEWDQVSRLHLHNSTGLTVPRATRIASSSSAGFPRTIKKNFPNTQRSCVATGAKRNGRRIFRVNETSIHPCGDKYLTKSRFPSRKASLLIIYSRPLLSAEGEKVQDTQHMCPI